jgi:hypothetical protein
MKNREPNPKTPPRTHVHVRLPLILHSLTLSLQPLAFSLSLCSCSIHPLKGGRAFTIYRPSGQLDQTITQSQNPSLPSSQSLDTIKIRTYTLPAGSWLDQDFLTRQSAAQAGPTTPPLHHSITPLLAVTEREESHATTRLGAAQKDSAREFAAKLSSLKGIVWLGVTLLIFGITSLIWPPLRTIIGSITTSAAITLGGFALMLLPTLIVGNELLILAGVALSLGAWFLAHRHGHLRGQLSSLRSQTNPNSPRGPIKN